MILTIIAFILVLGILILVHEFGHFLSARIFGVKVEEFAFGFPPKIWSIKRGETVYSINAIPVGGYVKMLGELEKNSSPRAFENQTRWKRFIISISGVLMNVILAWVILTIGFSIGMAPLVSTAGEISGKVLSNEIIIADVIKNSPAEKNNFIAGDVILRVESSNEKVSPKSVKEFSQFTSTNAGKEVDITYKRDSNIDTKSLFLSDNSDAAFGVAVIDKSVVQVPWYKAPIVALRETYQIIALTGDFLKSFFLKLFSTGKVSDQVGGPVAIYIYTGLAVKAGAMALLQFIALLSINLAIINLLPFPALDGGRILFIIIETIARKKIIKEKVENIIHMVGFALLLLLIGLVTYHDIYKLIVK